MRGGYIRVLAVGGSDTSVSASGDDTILVKRIYSRAVADFEHVSCFLEPTYIQVSSFLKITSFATIRDHRKHPENVLQGWYDLEAENERFPYYAQVIGRDHSLYGCTCHVAKHLKNKDGLPEADFNFIDCTCPAAESILPLYQVTVKNEGVWQMVDGLYGKEPFVPETVTYLVDPDERDFMKQLLNTKRQRL